MSLRIYIVSGETCYHTVVDAVAATSHSRARSQADLDEIEYVDMRSKLFCVDGKPLEAPGDLRQAWTDHRTAPLLRDAGYSFGDPDCSGRCECCDLDSFDGWSKAPAEWAVCDTCYRCGKCSADEHESEDDPDSICEDCADGAS